MEKNSNELTKTNTIISCEDLQLILQSQTPSKVKLPILEKYTKSWYRLGSPKPPNREPSETSTHSSLFPSSDFHSKSVKCLTFTEIGLLFAERVFSIRAGKFGQGHG